MFELSMDTVFYIAVVAWSLFAGIVVYVLAKMLQAAKDEFDD
jgi:hypothetical protein